jgi:SAM-dependent methyltransferase
MATTAPQLEIIDKLKTAAFGAFAMLAGMQLDVFTPLKDRPLSAQQIADGLGVDSSKLRPLLYALVTAGLLQVEGELFTNTAESAYFLVKGSPAYMGVRHQAWSIFWDGALKTAETIRTGMPQAVHDWTSMPQEQSEAWLRGIMPAAIAAGRDLAARHNFSTCRTLLDVGGGSGALAMAVTEVHPHIQATVLELPQVTPITQRFIDEAGAQERVQVLAADLVNDALSGSYDVVVMQRLIQVLTPEHAGRALKNVSAVLRPLGAIYIYGAVLENSRLAPVGDVVEDNIVLLNTTEGQAYTEQEYRVWLSEADFEGFAMIRLPNVVACIKARRSP